MARRRRRWSWAVGSVVVLAPVLASCQPTVPEGFRQEVVVAGLDLPTTWVQPPDPAVQYIAEKAGVVRVAVDGRVLANPLVDLRARVNDVGDQGLIGMALDPAFATTGHLYLGYTFEDPTWPVRSWGQTQRVTRVTVDVTSHTADPHSEVVVLGGATGADCWGVAALGAPADPAWKTPDCIPSTLAMHTLGDLAFDADGHLWISVGDGAEHHVTGAESVFRVQDVDVLAGKLLRIDPATGDGVPSNPFFQPESPGANASLVYAYGFRNPFRFTFRPGSGTPYVGDVGSGNFEEIDVVRPGANYGWPCYEGSLRNPDVELRAVCQPMYEAKTPVTPPAYSYPHDGQGVSITGGVFYPGGAYPASYTDDYVYGDYDGFVRRQKFSNGDAVVGSPIGLVTKEAAGAPVQLRIGPDGNIWYLSIYPGELRRLVYTGSAPAPATCPDGQYRAQYFNNRTLSGTPAAIRCETSINHDWGTAAPFPGMAADNFSVRWTGRVRYPGGTHRFTTTTDDGVRLRIDGTARIDRWVDRSVTANSADVRLTEGMHTVVVEHYDRTGPAVARVTSTRVGTAPTVTISAPADRSRVALGAQVPFTVSATDREDGPLPASRVTVEVAYLHYSSATDHHVHPTGTHAGTASGTFTALGGHGPGHYRLVARATDSSGWTAASRPVDVCLHDDTSGPC